MRKRVFRFISTLLTLVLMSGLAACTPPAEKPDYEPDSDLLFADLQSELGISFDNIICQYSYGDIVWDDEQDYFYEDFATNITIYADNTVRLWTSKSYYDTEALFETVSQITDEQKNSLLEAMMAPGLLTDSCFSSYDVLESDWGRGGRWKYLSFYDADGNEVHTCGGLNPDHPDFNNVSYLISEYFPYLSGDIVKLRAQTAPFMATVRLCDFIHSESKERSISCDKYAFTLYCGYDRYPYEGLEYDIDIETLYTMLPDGDLEIKVMATGYTGEYGTDSFAAVTNETSKNYDLSEEQTNRLIDILKKHFSGGTLLPADQTFEDIDIYLNWYGHIKLYDESGENIFNLFHRHFNLSDELKQEIRNMLITFDPKDSKDAAALPVAEELLSLS